MRQSAALRVGDHLLDHGVTTVLGLCLQHRERGGGEHRVMPPDVEQLALLCLPVAAGGARRLSRRTIRRPVARSRFGRDPNAAYGISATSASEISSPVSVSTNASG